MRLFRGKGKQTPPAAQAQEPAQGDQLPAQARPAALVDLERLQAAEASIARIDALYTNAFAKIEEIATIAVAEKKRGLERDQTIDRLLWELEDTRKGRAIAEAQRDSLSQQIGELRGELKAAQRQIEHASMAQGQRLEDLKGQVITMQGQIEYLTKERADAANTALRAMGRVYVLRAALLASGIDPDSVDHYTTDGKAQGAPAEPGPAGPTAATE